MDQQALIVLLPERRRLTSVSLSAAATRTVSQADVLSNGAPGFGAQLQRHFRCVGTALPSAALLAGADDDSIWLRVEVAHVRAEMGVLRLMAYGEGLGLSDDERMRFNAVAAEILPTDEWCWREVDGVGYLVASTPAVIPDFASPDDLLGADILDHYPPPHWRARFTEAQIALHAVDFNRQRESRGQWPVNAVLFWGAGRSAPIESDLRLVESDDALLQALVKHASPTPTALGKLLDRRAQRDFNAVFESDINPALRNGQNVILDSADGWRVRLHRSQRWRFWRRARAELF